MYSNYAWVTGDVISAARLLNLETQWTEAVDETHATASISAGTLTLPMATSRIFNTSHNANITTTTITGVPASTRRAVLEIHLAYTATPYTWAWLTSTVRWTNGVAPVLTQVNGKKDVFVVYTLDGGTTWFGTIVQQNVTV